jgi:hypothetical protein
MFQPVLHFTYLTEIKLTNNPAANQVYKFADVPELRNKAVKQSGPIIIKTNSIQAYKRSDLTVTPNSNVTVNLLTGIVLTLQIGSTEEFFRYPCNDLNPAANSGVMRILANKEINLTNSYITILDATGLAQNDSVLFNFCYKK